MRTLRQGESYPIDRRVSLEEQLKNMHKKFLLKHGNKPVLVVWHPGKYRKDTIDLPVDTSIQEGTFWFECAEKQKK
ncbi:MAG: hypothetical protein WC935_00180 [Thermoleophilia bacterium]